MRIPVTNCEIAQPVRTRFRKKARRGKPISKTETPKKGMAKRAAGIIPIRVRIILMEARAAMSSTGRSGETKRFPRFLDHNSSRNESV
jgi:hypothetical protein